MRWLIRMFTYPEHNIPVRAAVFGKLLKGREPNKINPWVAQWMIDLQYLADEQGEHKC